jgi:phosphoribosylformimino-5-aminoimidazole carboxamide ribotide isomerase
MDDTKQKFTVYPAIDLRGGRVVRLVEGDPARQTVYGDDPAQVARSWLEAGASWLHVVNLGGAFGESAQANLSALQSILGTIAAHKPSAWVQFGGGLRSLPDIESALQAGVQRVMLGTIAVESPHIVAQALERFGAGRIGLALDARQGRVHIRGWAQSAAVDPIELGKYLYASGLRTCAYTDIARDGGGGGIHIEATQRFARATGLSVIASGGAASIEDVRRVRQAGLSGIIIGRALYEGHIDLKEALTC